MQSSLGRLLLGIHFLTMQRSANVQVPCNDRDCTARFPEGGYCTFLPTSPFCDPRTPKCLGSDGCSCCRNCVDDGCSSVGKGWSCVNETTAAVSNKFCIQRKGCKTSNQAGSKCYCCPPTVPTQCEDRGCRQEGGECVKESQAQDCEIHQSSLCLQNEEAKEKCLCCKRPPERCNQTSRECARRGPGYSCVSQEDAADWPVPCEHHCHDSRSCMCCPPKPVDVECLDTGCSKEFPGFECQNASVARHWPKRCMESDKLCTAVIEEYEVNMTADNAFKIYADGDPLGSGNDWQTTYTLPTDASKVLAIYAWNWGGPVGIILSTSNGLVTDLSWKCTSKVQSGLNWTKPSFNDESWSNAVSFGHNGVPPWGLRPGILASAQWIWAPTWSQRVWCRKDEGAPKCFCCPPIEPVNNCTDNGCGGAFGEGYLGECKDVTNPDFISLSQAFDLDAMPTGENLCNKSVEKSCCRCFKKKPCLDDGCQDAFHGDGICVDVENDDLSMIDFSVEKKLGLCKKNLKKDCCFCYKKKGWSDCHHKRCTYEGMAGECVGPRVMPPPNHVKTDGECPGKDCVCWVPVTEKCSRDPVCEESLHGQCLPDGAHLPGYKPSNYMCQDLANRNCTCWTPYCENTDCKDKGGMCLLPWEHVPAGYQPNGLVCNEELNCKCYTRKTCEQTEECEKVMGTCRYPTDPRPADEVEGNFCDEDLGCKCYYTKCTNSDCKDKGGMCLLPWERIPAGYQPNGLVCNEELNCKCYARKTCEQTEECEKVRGTCRYPTDPRPADEVEGNFCDEDLGCKCYYTKCTNPDCKDKGGMCLLPWERVPAGYQPNGLVCNEDLNCKCYARKTCEQTEECEKIMGTCRHPTDPRPADEVEGNFCDEDLGCKCYYTKCTNPTCAAARGLCVLPSDPIPNSNAYSYKAGDFCNKRTNCKCFRPRCLETRLCTRLKGRCFMKGMAIPAGSTKVIYKGKPVYCNKGMKCRCLKVPIVAEIAASQLLLTARPPV